MFHSFYSAAAAGGDVRFHFAWTLGEAETLRARLAEQGRRVTDCREAIAGDPSVWEVQAHLQAR